MGHQISCSKRDTAASGQSLALNDKICVSALRMLAKKIDNTELALEFKRTAPC
jgi:hypothetical protein